MKKHLCILFALMLVTSCSSSSAPTGGGNNITVTGEKVTGTVQDTSGAPISGATVTLEEAVIYSTKTNAKGTFEFDNVPAGSYRIEATMSKYSTDSQTVVVSSGSSSTASFTIYRIMPLIPEAGLACLYRFAGTAVDSSTNHHNGIVSGCTFIPDRFGTAGNAIHFSASSDLVTVPDATDLDFGDSASYTICFWVELEGPPSGGAFALLKLDPATFQSTGYYFQQSTAAIIATFRGATNGIGLNFSPLTQQTWQFIALVVDGKRGITTTWVNGSAGTPVTDALWTHGTANSYPLKIGYLFLGAIDDIRMYNRALTADEISELYHENGW